MRARTHKNEKNSTSDIQDWHHQTPNNSVINFDSNEDKYPLEGIPETPSARNSYRFHSCTSRHAGNTLRGVDVADLESDGNG